MGRSWKKRRHFPPDPVSNPQQPASRSGTRTEIAVTAERFAGPLPHPDILERYDKIVPGLAERIVKMAEGQSQHRQGLEHMVVQSNTRAAGPGLRLSHQRAGDRRIHLLDRFWEEH